MEDVVLAHPGWLVSFSVLFSPKYCRNVMMAVGGPIGVSSISLGGIIFLPVNAPADVAVGLECQAEIRYY